MYSYRFASLLLVVPLLASAVLAIDVTVTKVTGEVEALRDGQAQPLELKGGETLTANDRIYTGMESSAELKFADNSTVVVKELTDMKIGAFQEGGNAVKTRIWLKAGEVSAALTHQGGVKSDFQIKSPTATCSVRGSDVSFGSANGIDKLEMGSGNANLGDNQGNNTNASGTDKAQAKEGQGVQGNSQIQNTDGQANIQTAGLTGAEVESSRTGAFIQSPNTLANGDSAGATGGNSGIQDLRDDSSALHPDEPLVPDGNGEVDDNPVDGNHDGPPVNTDVTVVGTSNNSPATLDASQVFRNFDLSGINLHGGPDVVTDVNVKIEFAKHDGQGFNADGTGTPFFNEIHFALQSPAGTSVELISAGSFQTGDSPKFDGEIVFDQNAELAVNHNTARPEDGEFRPIGDLGAFNGQPIRGTWRLQVQDTVGADSLDFFGAKLDIRNTSGQVGTPPPPQNQPLP